MPDTFRPDTFRPGPPRPSRILRPAAFSMPVGAERYEVPGAGGILIAVGPGDRISIENTQGGQICELVAAADGVIDAGILGRPGNADAAGLKALLATPAGPGPGLGRLRLGIERRGINLARAGAIRLFDAQTPAGTTETLTATRAGVLIIAAPGAAMDPGGQDTTTPLVVKLQRSTLHPIPRFDLPDPLASPILDLRVKSSTAESYFVKAGDYIQILDVDGQQMTDFQCFSARKLDQGIEHPLDVTTTRTFTGRDYPMPGLQSKFFDQDWLPLVEVIQDTVGRHDAFAMACAPKYYDDIGYPGHINCSDNFNAALAPHGITKRPGWMAINFFYNTRIDAHGMLTSDEAWSRPGDYVLLRALTDIICVSSACPDDTSAGNGWFLSDIHVRTYSGAAPFQRAIALRLTPNSEPVMSKQTAFHDSLHSQTNDLVEYKGYWLPQSFPTTGTIGEYWACRQKVAVIDLSPLRKWEITGPDAEALLQYALTRDIRQLSTGQVVYSAMCYEHGGMIDDGTLFRLGVNNFRWIGGDDYGGIWLREWAEKLGLQVMIRSSTDQLHNLAVQGPHARDLVSRIIWTPATQPAVADLGWFRFAIGRIGNATGAPLVVSRTGYTGELGYEIFCHPKDAHTVFDAVWTAGADLGLKPLGLAALDMLRIEAGLIFAGYDFSDQTDPFEAGIGFTVPLKSKPDDFIGRSALMARKDHPRHRFVGLDVAANTSIGHGDPVFNGRAQIGVVTSATRSPILNKNIALARIDVTHATQGASVEIGKLDGQQLRLPATITPTAQYDPKKTRPQS